jgi:hypothetical protein
MGDMGAYVSDKACTTPVLSAMLCFSQPSPTVLQDSQM